MKSFLTIKQLAVVLKVTEGYLQYYIKKCPYAQKQTVKIKVRSRKGIYLAEKEMWILDKKYLNDFVAFWNERKKTKPKIIEDNGTNYRWTETAKDCFNAKQICENCPNCDACAKVFEIIHRKPIKDYVRKTFSLIGKPPERIYNND